MAKISLIKKEESMPKLVNVCAYARVSSDKDAMLHSLSSQISYFSKYIQLQKNWHYVGVYYDEGISGTKSTREGFNKMIEDAKNGKINIIVTKSLSRFARNTVDCLKTIRELKAINVDIYFQEQNIHTLSSNGEFLISLLAGYAQEEARQVSENTLWRVKKNFNEGKPYGGYRFFGFKYQDGKFVVIEEEAKLVKKTFELYLNGYGQCKIAKYLNEIGSKTILGNSWGRGSVRQLLTNISYTGDLLLQKKYVENYLTKKSKRNKGEKPMYLVEDNHEALVSKDTFSKVQELMKAKDKGASKERTHHPLSGLVRCGICGHQCNRVKQPNYYYYHCNLSNQMGQKSCNAKRIRETILMELLTKELGLAEFNEEIVRNKIDFVELFNEQKVVIHFKDDTLKEVYWKMPSRSESWTKEMKEQARIRREIQNGKRQDNTK